MRSFGSGGIYRVAVVGLCVTASAAHAQGQSTAKELFIGLDGSTMVLEAQKSPGPAKPLKPKVLGLQTTVYQLFEDGGVKAVSPRTVFSAGNRIRLGFNANKDGYLYVVNVGTSGNVTTLFPHSTTDNNQVRAGLVYQIPQQTGKSIKFDSKPGEETLLVVLSESRISSFEYAGQMIALKDPKSTGSSTADRGHQRVALSSIDNVASAKDLFVEDDGVFQTAVFKLESDAVSNKAPLVTTIKLTHR